jgi:hypothetical protein
MGDLDIGDERVPLVKGATYSLPGFLGVNPFEGRRDGKSKMK